MGFLLIFPKNLEKDDDARALSNNMHHNGQPPLLFPAVHFEVRSGWTKIRTWAGYQKTGKALTWLAVIFGKESVSKRKITYAALRVSEVWDYTLSYGFAVPISEWAIL